MLALFSASAYYRATWINYAAIIVCVCVLVIFERGKSLLEIPDLRPNKQSLTEINFFEKSTSNLKHDFFYLFIFLVLLEFSMFHKTYILCKIIKLIIFINVNLYNFFGFTF